MDPQRVNMEGSEGIYFFENLELRCFLLSTMETSVKRSTLLVYYVNNCVVPYETESWDKW